ncbi:MAG: hypothetical protein KDD44_13065, partial [Bdellovibrionales bacterium]|nr:hypothetical protein [Bdellovibrionales bacterium]
MLGCTTLIRAVTSSESLLDRVEFFVDGASIGSPDFERPYSVWWNTTNASSGSHVVTARAFSSSGDVSESSIEVFVSTSQGCTTPSTGFTAGSFIDPPEQVEGQVGDILELTPLAVMPGVSDLSYSMTFVGQANPAGATFNSNTRRFRWQTSVGQQGTHLIRFQAHTPGGALAAERDVSVTLTQTDKPVIRLKGTTAGINNYWITGQQQVFLEGDYVRIVVDVTQTTAPIASVTVSTSAPNLSGSWSPTASNASQCVSWACQGTLRFSTSTWYTNALSAGRHRVVVTAIDTAGRERSTSFELVVRNNVPLESNEETLFLVPTIDGQPLQNQNALFPNPMPTLSGTVALSTLV